MEGPQAADNDKDLTSTISTSSSDMGKLLSTNKDEKNDLNDTLPTSSTDANTSVKSINLVSDDPISSTSSEMESTKTKANEKALSHGDDKVPTEVPSCNRIEENVDDIVSDLETLLGESANSFDMTFKGTKGPEVATESFNVEDEIAELLCDKPTENEVSSNTDISCSGKNTDKDVPLEKSDTSKELENVKDSPDKDTAFIESEELENTNVQPNIENAVVGPTDNIETPAVEAVDTVSDTVHVTDSDINKSEPETDTVVGEDIHKIPGLEESEVPSVAEECSNTSKNDAIENKEFCENLKESQEPIDNADNSVQTVETLEDSHKTSEEKDDEAITKTVEHPDESLQPENIEAELESTQTIPEESECQKSSQNDVTCSENLAENIEKPTEEADQSEEKEHRKNEIIEISEIPENVDVNTESKEEVLDIEPIVEIPDDAEQPHCSSESLPSDTRIEEVNEEEIVKEHLVDDKNDLPVISEEVEEGVEEQEDDKLTKIVEECEKVDTPEIIEDFVGDVQPTEEPLKDNILTEDPSKEQFSINEPPSCSTEESVKQESISTETILEEKTENISIKAPLEEDSESISRKAPVEEEIESIPLQISKEEEESKCVLETIPLKEETKNDPMEASLEEETEGVLIEPPLQEEETESIPVEVPLVEETESIPKEARLKEETNENVSKESLLQEETKSMPVEDHLARETQTTPMEVPLVKNAETIKMAEAEASLSESECNQDNITDVEINDKLTKSASKDGDCDNLEIVEAENNDNILQKMAAGEILDTEKAVEPTDASMEDITPLRDTKSQESVEETKNLKESITAETDNRESTPEKSSQTSVSVSDEISFEKLSEEPNKSTDTSAESSSTPEILNEELSKISTNLKTLDSCSKSVEITESPQNIETKEVVDDSSISPVEIPKPCTLEQSATEKPKLSSEEIANEMKDKKNAYVSEGVLETEVLSVAEVNKPNADVEITDKLIIEEPDCSVNKNVDSKTDTNECTKSLTEEELKEKTERQLEHKSDITTPDKDNRAQIDYEESEDSEQDDDVEETPTIPEKVQPVPEINIRRKTVEQDLEKVVCLSEESSDSDTVQEVVQSLPKPDSIKENKEVEDLDADDIQDQDSETVIHDVPMTEELPPNQEESDLIQIAKEVEELQNTESDEPVVSEIASEDSLPPIDDVIANQNQDTCADLPINTINNIETMMAVASLQKETISETREERRLSEKELREIEAIRVAVASITDSSQDTYDSYLVESSITMENSVSSDIPDLSSDVQDASSGPQSISEPVLVEESTLLSNDSADVTPGFNLTSKESDGQETERISEKEPKEECKESPVLKEKIGSELKEKVVNDKPVVSSQVDNVVANVANLEGDEAAIKAVPSSTSGDLPVVDDKLDSNKTDSGNLNKDKELSAIDVPPVEETKETEKLPIKGVAGVENSDVVPVTDCLSESEKQIATDESPKEEKESTEGEKVATVDVTADLGEKSEKMTDLSKKADDKVKDISKDTPIEHVEKEEVEKEDNKEVTTVDVPSDAAEKTNVVAVQDKETPSDTISESVTPESEKMVEEIASSPKSASKENSVLPTEEAVNERPLRNRTRRGNATVSEPLSINVEEAEKKEKVFSPKVVAKSLKVSDEEVSTTSDAELNKTSLKMTITKQSDKLHSSILKVYNPEEEIESEASHDSQEEPIPKLIIKPKVQQVEQQHSPKMTTRSSKVYSPTNSQRCSSPRVTIKPVVKPSESKVETFGPLKITFKPVVKPDDRDGFKRHSPKTTKEQETKNHNPKITIKPIPKPTNELESEEVVPTTPKVTIKPVKRPAEDIDLDKQERSSPKITIKPVVKTPEEHTDQHNQTTPRLIIKPIKKQDTETVEPEQVSPSPKISIKPVVKPADLEDEDKVEEVQERIVLKINKGNLPTPSKDSKKREYPEDEKSVAKIKLKFSTSGGHPHIVQEKEGNKRQRKDSGYSVNTGVKEVEEPTHKRSLSDEKTPEKSKRLRSSITPDREKEDSNDEVKLVESKIDSPIVISEDSRSQNSDCVIIENTPSDSSDISKISEIASRTTHIELASVVTVGVVTPAVSAPKRRGRPRKVPLEVREELPPEPSPTSDVASPASSKITPSLSQPSSSSEANTPEPSSAAAGRPKRSCRGQNVIATLGIKPRKPRGGGRGRGGKVNMGDREPVPVVQSPVEPIQTTPMKPEKVKKDKNKSKKKKKKSRRRSKSS